MYTLSFYEGSSELSFAFGRKLFKFPYTYLPNLFSGSFTRDEFYTDVFNLAAKDLEVDLSGCEINVTGVLEPPKIPFNVTKSSCLLTSLPDDHIFVSSSAISLNGNCHSHMPLTVYESEDNLFANMTIYSNVVSADTHDINVSDTLLREILVDAEMKFKGDKILVTGDRIINFALNPPLSYLLVFDLIRQPGIYYVEVDKQNQLPHMLMLDMEGEYASLGTLVNSPGPTECLFKTDVGTSQLIDLEQDKLFIIPLESDSEAKLMVKNSQGQVEKKARGGELGVVLDTRNKAENFEFQDVGVDAIIQALNKIS